jgi:hypothetical protein
MIISGWVLDKVLILLIFEIELTTKKPRFSQRLRIERRRGERRTCYEAGKRGSGGIAMDVETLAEGMAKRKNES